MTSKILITGGTGFFGRALLRHYLTDCKSADAVICVLSRNPDHFREKFPELVNSPCITLFKGDIEDPDSLPWSQTFTHILHAATDSTVGPRLTPLKRFRQIVDGTTNILELAIKTGASRFLLTSSGGIYGQQPPDLETMPECWLGSPALDQVVTSYSQAKRTAEHLCALYRDAYGLKTVIARCFAFVGQDLPLDVHFAIGNFIYDALNSDVITVSGDGSPLRTYLDQRDLAHWLWVLLNEGHDGETYNVGSDYVTSISDLAHLVRDLLSPAKSVIIKSKNTLGSSRNRYIPDISKARDLHGLVQSYTLQESILFAAASASGPSRR